MAFLLAGLATPSAHAWQSNQEWMTNFSGCDSPCNGNSSLSHTGDQIGSFQHEWARVPGNSTTVAYTNGNVWATDYIEDTDFGGYDYQVTDDVQMFVYSGHGGNSNNAWGQSYWIPTCHANSSNYSCNVDIEDARLGEYFGPYASPMPGYMDWAILLTCYSVDTAPDQQWAQTMWYGTDFIMGFRGQSADSSLTNGDAGNFVDDAFGINHTYTFKSVWLDKGDADWITGGDTPAVVAAGVGSSDATSRRDNYSINTTLRRVANNPNPANYFAWSWAD
jgi:hypothetical protein